MLTVGLDEHGLVNDFYYPYVGLENLTTARSAHHMMGIWVDNQFSWVDDGSWTTIVDFEPDALVSLISMENEGLGIKLELSDFVDSEFNTFCRTITVANQHDDDREIRLFMHQVFQISRAGRADTALFVPDTNYLLDYKGRVSLLIYGETDGIPFDQFAVGSYGIEGKEGTYKDAEDGELSGNAVEHGGVDSVMRFKLNLKAHSSQPVDYWVVAADSKQSAEKIHTQILENSMVTRREKTRFNWQAWLSLSVDKRKNVPAEYKNMVSKSLIVLRSHIDKRGGIIASCDSSIYNYGRDYYSYVWPRDGAYAIWPLIRLGYTDEPKKFFEFCRDIMNPDGYLMHKYQPDRAIGSTWHPLLHDKRSELAIQEDETAIVLYMLGEYFEYSDDEAFVHSLYSTFIQPAANFMCSFIDEQTNLPHASYDLWEMKFFTNTYSVAVVYQALLVAAEFAKRFEFPDDAIMWDKTAQLLFEQSDVFYNPETESYRKGYLLQENGSLEFENTLDVSSLYGAMVFGYYSSIDKLHSTASAIEEKLLDSTPSGGVPRFESDSYFLAHHEYLGNPWIVTTLWMAQYYARTNQLDKTKRYLDWALDHALDSGVMPEQVDPISGDVVSVTPLVWSHAEFINTVLDLTKAK